MRSEERSAFAFTVLAMGLLAMLAPVGRLDLVLTFLLLGLFAIRQWNGPYAPTGLGARLNVFLLVGSVGFAALVAVRIAFYLRP